MNILLVIDLQKEFYKDKKEDKILSFIKNNYSKFDKVIATVFINTEDSNFVKALDYKDCKHSNIESIEFDGNYIILKKTYGLDIKELTSRGITKNDTIYVVGCDSDACIMATCFTLFDNEYDFRILSNYIYTTSSDFSNEDVLKILKRNFGKFVI